MLLELIRMWGYAFEQAAHAMWDLETWLTHH